MKFVHGFIYKIYIIEPEVAVLFSAGEKVIAMKLCKSIGTTI
jgi:hypothetical protein